VNWVVGEVKGGVSLDQGKGSMRIFFWEGGVGGEQTNSKEKRGSVRNAKAGEEEK